MRRKTSISVLDLFCGCGGISKGFELAGYKIVGGIDFNKDATNTFEKNFKAAKVICGDISDIKDEHVLDLFAGTQMIVGGPPCQGFSSANRWQKEQDDPRNKLFFQFLRFVRLLSPSVIMIENVRGLLTRDDGYAKDRIKELLEEMHYRVSMKVLCASDYGVPQDRFRAIIVGVKDTIAEKEFDFDSIPHKDKVTVVEAIGELFGFEYASPENRTLPFQPLSKYQKYLRRADSFVPDHDIIYPAPYVQERISHVPQGGNWQDVPVELWKNNRTNRHSSAYKRLLDNGQSCTIDTGNAHSNYFHPVFNRIPSIRESARLQSFPDSFEFTGSRGSRYTQVGNAVPPLLANAIAIELKKYFK